MDNNSSVYLCGSFRHLDMMTSLFEKLQSQGITCTMPVPDSPKGISGCLEQIKNANITYVINPDGYIGKSVSVDIGYALALGKKVYSLAPIEDPPVGHLISGVASMEEIAVLSS